LGPGSELIVREQERVVALEVSSTCCIGGGGSIGEKGARLVAEGSSSLQCPAPTTAHDVLILWIGVCAELVASSSHTFTPADILLVVLYKLSLTLVLSYTEVGGRGAGWMSLRATVRAARGSTGGTTGAAAF